MKVVKQKLMQDGGVERRLSSAQRRLVSQLAGHTAYPGTAAKDEATLARELAAYIQQMNKQQASRQPAIRVKKTQPSSTAAAQRLIFNPLHPSQELPPEQLIRLINIHSGKEPLFQDKPRRKRTGKPASSPADALKTPVRQPAIRFAMAEEPFEEPKSRRPLVLGTVAVMVVAGTIALAMYLGGDASGQTAEGGIDRQLGAVAATAPIAAQAQPATPKKTTQPKTVSTVTAARKSTARPQEPEPAEKPVKPSVRTVSQASTPMVAETVRPESARENYAREAMPDNDAVTKSDIVEPESGGLYGSQEEWTDTPEMAPEVSDIDVPAGQAGETEGWTDTVVPATGEADTNATESTLTPAADEVGGGIYRDEQVIDVPEDFVPADEPGEVDENDLAE